MKPHPPNPSAPPIGVCFDTEEAAEAAATAAAGAVIARAQR